MSCQKKEKIQLRIAFEHKIGKKTSHASKEKVVKIDGNLYGKQMMKHFISEFNGLL